MMTVHNHDHREAFTLVELLVVTLIIGLLASVVLFALAASQERAREARTRSQISKIDQLISARWESYLTRRVPTSTTSPNRRTSATNRLDALRELMRMEMPDRRTDVFDGPVSGISPPALWLSYQRRVQAATGETDWAYPNGAIANAWTPTFQEAECLYMILASIQDGETNGLEFFHQTEIGDVDGDGMQEILDGWGNPIEFLRWAPGFVSVKQEAANANSPPDPFDPLHIYVDLPNKGFILFPLIFSAGPDEEYKVNLDDKNTNNNKRIEIQYSLVNNDPYVKLPTSNNLIGNLSLAEPGHIDNIHNHLTDTVLH